MFLFTSIIIIQFLLMTNNPTATREKPNRAKPTPVVQLPPLQQTTPPSIQPQPQTVIPPALPDSETDSDDENQPAQIGVVVQPNVKVIKTKAIHYSRVPKNDEVSFTESDTEEMTTIDLTKTKNDDGFVKTQLTNITQNMINDVKDNLEDMFVVDRKKTKKKAMLGGLYGFIVLAITILFIVLLKKI